MGDNDLIHLFKNFNCICHFLDQLRIAMRCLYKHRKSSKESIILYTTQSSVNSQIVDEIFSSILLMCNKNIRDPKTVPCGTADFIDSILDT